MIQTYSADPEKDADRHMEQVYQSSLERWEATKAAQEEFIEQLMNKPMDAQSSLKHRAPYTVFEAASDSLDYPRGPSYKDVLELLVRVAKAGDAQACDIINRMAETYAYYRE